MCNVIWLFVFIINMVLSQESSLDLLQIVEKDEIDSFIKIYPTLEIDSPLDFIDSVTDLKADKISQYILANVSHKQISSTNSGLMMNKIEYYKNICSIALKYGYQINTHVIGDSAVRVMLDIYSCFLKGKNDLRWRIEHSQVVSPDDISKYSEYSIVPSVNMLHATSDMYWAEKRLGKERIKFAYAYKKLLQQNGWLCNGSDFPVENINPLYGYYAAVARKDLNGYPPDGFQKENAITRIEALKAMTIWAARSFFEENEKGSIEPGKYADIVVLDKDIMTVPEKEIPTIKVLMTYVNGELVFSQK